MPSACGRHGGARLQRPCKLLSAYQGILDQTLILRKSVCMYVHRYIDVYTYIYTYICNVRMVFSLGLPDVCGLSWLLVVIGAIIV